MTDDERALLLALARIVSAGLETPWKDRQVLRDLVRAATVPKEPDRG